MFDPNFIVTSIKGAAYSYDNTIYKVFLLFVIIYFLITFLSNHFIPSMVISCGLDITICALLYLRILLITKDNVFFEIYNRMVIKLKALF